MKTHWTLAEELIDLKDFVAKNCDKDGLLSRGNMTFVYRRLQAIAARATAEAERMESDAEKGDPAAPAAPVFPPHAQD